MPSYVGVPVVAVGLWLLVTRGSYRKVERVLLVLGFVLVTYVVSGILASPDWSGAARGALVPHAQMNSLWLFTVVAAVGTTLTPWGQFFIQAAVVDKKISLRQYVYTKYEIYVGSVMMTTVDFFIVLACAGTLYKENIVIRSAEEAALALAPFLGSAAQYLFGLGLLSVSILAAGVLPLATAYVVCEAFGFESGLDSTFREAPVFNGIITFLMFVPAAVAVIPGLPLVRVILVAQSLNGILLPVILVFTLLIINNPRVMGEHVNGPVAQRRRLELLRCADLPQRLAAALTVLLLTLRCRRRARGSAARCAPARRSWVRTRGYRRRCARRPRAPRPPSRSRRR